MTSFALQRIHVDVPYGRGAIALLCIALAFVAPWWCAPALAALVYLLLGHAEVLAVGPVVDALYFEGWYITAALASVYVAAHFLRRRLLPRYQL